MEEEAQVREEVDGRDRLLVFQEGAGGGPPLEEVPQPEGRSIAEGHALQQAPVNKTVDLSQRMDEEEGGDLRHQQN